MGPLRFLPPLPLFVGVLEQQRHHVLPHVLRVLPPPLVVVRLAQVQLKREEGHTKEQPFTVGGLSFLLRLLRLALVLGLPGCGRGTP